MDTGFFGDIKKPIPTEESGLETLNPQTRSHMKPYVIAINSISGGGKTALTTALGKELQSSTTYHFDDFDDTNIYPDDFVTWWAEGADVHQFEFPGMTKAVTETLETNESDFILLDYPFGRSHKALQGAIDLSLYIDTPLDIALARRGLRDYTSHEDQQKLKNHLDHYISSSRPLYLDSGRYKEECDLVLDGSNDIEKLTAQVVEKIKKR